MKKIIFIEGVDGSGKTTLSAGLSNLLSAKYKQDVQLLNKYSPRYYGDLFEIDRKNGIQCSPLAKLSYRVARLSLALDHEVRSMNKTAIFDRGPVNTILDSMEDGIPRDLLSIFLKDMFVGVEEYGIQMILLRPPLETVFQRLSTRKELAHKEKSSAYITGYYEKSFKVFKEIDFTSNKMVIDTEKLTIGQCLQEIERVVCSGCI
ncbi:MAG: hypothetical protein ACRBG0_04975 [Lewinella sp.]|uniref:hypothetical protein n=1 Tax=Lewinella sp. TaxID=2004506 RepID=UPI003D6B4D04